MNNETYKKCLRFGLEKSKSIGDTISLAHLKDCRLYQKYTMKNSSKRPRRPNALFSWTPADQNGNTQEQRRLTK